MAFHPCDRSCDHKHCDSGDIMFLICLMTSSQHVFKGLCGFMVDTLHSVWWPPVTTLPCLVVTGLVEVEICSI